MSLADWSQDQLRRFVQKIIEEKRWNAELPSSEKSKVGAVLQWNGIEWLPSTQGQYWGALSAPPSSPADGDTFDLLVDTTNGIVWRFRYRATSGSSFKWEFVGGPPLYDEQAANDFTGSTTYVALFNAGPAIALPRGGDYLVSTGFSGYSDVVAGTAYQNLMSYDIGGTGAVDADAVVSGSTDHNVEQDSAARTRRKTGLSAVTLTAKYRVIAGTNNFLRRWMQVIPIRIS